MIEEEKKGVVTVTEIDMREEAEYLNNINSNYYDSPQNKVRLLTGQKQELEALLKDREIQLDYWRNKYFHLEKKHNRFVRIVKELRGIFNSSRFKSAMKVMDFVYHDWDNDSA